MSQEHAKLSGSADSPGPAVYTQRASVGPQVSGAKESSPLFCSIDSKCYTTVGDGAISGLEETGVEKLNNGTAKGQLEALRRVGE